MSKRFTLCCVVELCKPINTSLECWAMTSFVQKIHTHWDRGKINHKVLTMQLFNCKWLNFRVYGYMKSMIKLHQIKATENGGIRCATATWGVSNLRFSAWSVLEVPTTRMSCQITRSHYHMMTPWHRNAIRIIGSLRSPFGFSSSNESSNESSN